MRTLTLRKHAVEHVNRIAVLFGVMLGGSTCSMENSGGGLWMRCTPVAYGMWRKSKNSVALESDMVVIKDASTAQGRPRKRATSKTNSTTTIMLQRFF